MSFRLFKESSITPSVRSINLRNYLRDSDGPHLVTFGIRAVVADAAAGMAGVHLTYETENGQLRTILLDSGGIADLTTIQDNQGAMWYSNQVLMADKGYILGDGPGADPYGTMTLDFTLGGSAGSAKISYECIITVFDGSPSVVVIP